MTIINGVPIPPATLSAISVSLTVAGDTGDTPIGNAAPTDPLYPASLLMVTVTALPTDGTVMLSNGTLVKVGETLTVAQLTGLEFAPTPGLFNQSSTFTYSVKDPAGLTATGSDTLKIAADTSPPKASSATLTVTGNSGATPANIVAPTDANFTSSQLTVTVTALPTDGTVLLSNGTTAVTVGETLTVAQLTGLEFRPTAGVFGQSSTFTYSVTDPAGLTASGSETLKIAADTSPPIATNATLNVAGNAKATAINIPAPGDPNYTASQLTVTVAALPTDGSVLLSNGTTAVTVGETLTVAQLTGLEFQPTADAFGQSSNFTYSVKDPAGLTASGSETLKIAADTTPPVATNGTLTVAGNAKATAINIASPSDPNYTASQLTVAVTALPTDGEVLLSNGTTAVTVGETLTVAQLTGLEFQPTAGAFGQSSNFTYSVKDPAGLTASGSETLKIAVDTTPPVATNGTLTIAENAAATAINIPSPSDPNYTASQLTVAVTALPTDGEVLLSNGTTAVTVGETLTVAQLTGLEFQPTAGVSGQSSTFTYSVKDPAGLTASGSEILAIGSGTGISPDGTTLMGGSAGSLVTSAGTWTFGTAAGSAGDAILLNGQPAAAGWGTELLVANQGNLYTENSSGNWYEWNGTGWSQTTNPSTKTVDTSPPVATNGTLTIAENAAATAINIASPSDPNYTASQLTVAVTALPTDGEVLLSNGTTAVTVGETLTVAQLTGLEFQPTAGVSGQSSTFTYSVKDPAALTASGSETLAVAADTTPPTTIDPILTVAENSAATAINIPSPSDPNYTASQLTVAVTALPTDGEVLLSNGTTAVTVGETLTVAQLTGLEFQPTAGVSGQSSTFTYSVKDPAGLTASGSEILAIGSGTGISPDGTTLMGGSAGSLVTSAGTWTFGTAAGSAGDAILLNGQPAAAGWGTELLVANQGNLYTENSSGNWYEWNGTGWSQTTNPSTKTVDTSPPVATNGTLTIAENAAATAINIASPSDPNYTASQLTVAVTALPTDGEVLLSNGTTAVTVGETLTVAQLTGLEFQPTAGVSGQSSTFTYSVKDPAALTASGSETLAVAADTTPPTTIDPILTVAENSAATAINIPSPSDPNYTASQLTVAVTALPTDGEVLLSNGTTAVTVGETLTVAQLTGLEFQPTAGVSGQSSTFTYSVKDPAGLTASGSEILAIGSGTGISPDGTTLMGGSAGSLVTSAGTWTFGTAAGSAGDAILLNGQPAAAGWGTELLVANQGNLYTENSSGNWYEWNGTGWSQTTNPSTKTVDTSPPVATNGTLTIAENAAATAINIASPSDPNYTASQLTVAVTALPTDGEVLLSNGTTAVTVGETLTVAQLTGLEFQPTAGVSGQSSTFTYSVKDPAALTASGSETLAVAADTTPPTTIDPILTVAENSAATAINIPSPSDPNYTASQLTVAVTALPTDGEVLLSNGTTAVTVGETLTVAQLTGLEFQPTAGVSGQSSTFTYSVKDPAGLTASGSEILAIGSGTGISPDGTTLMGGSAGSLVTSAGTWTFGTAAGSAGDAILLNGQPAAAGWGTELLVANQGNLYTENSSGNWYEWNGTGWSQTTNPTGTSTSTQNQPAASSSTSSSAGPVTVDSTPVIIQPSQPGDIVGVQLQNTGSTAESSGYVTFGEVFKDGAVTPGESLVARINGVNYAVQMDVKTTNTDGSVSDAVLTLDAPAIAANSSISVMLAQGTASAPSVTAPSPQSLLTSLLAGSDNTTVNFTFNNADGSTTTDSTSAAQALQQALANGTVQTWLSGPEVNQYDVTTTVDNGNLKVEFDIQAYANGTTSTNVIFDNSWMNSPGKTDLNYNVSIGQGGQTVYSANNVEQYLYSLWNYQANSAGTISPNVQYDISYLESTGAIQAYDTSVGVAASTISSYAATLNATNTGPLGTADVTTYMPTTGGRDDIGPQPGWVSEWLLSQSATAEQTMMANADAAGGIPWHFTDESTGEPINPITYSNFWDDSRGYASGDTEPANGLPDYPSAGGQISADGDPWVPDAAHMPDLNYVPYLVTGSPYQLELLQAQADYAISSMNPGYAQELIPGSNVPYGIINTANQTRAIAWSIREIAEAAYATPNSDPLKAAYTTELQGTMASMVQQYITGGADSANGQIQGFIQGANTPQVAPWQQDYIVTSLAEVAGMNIPQASTEAVEMLQYMNNFVSGMFTNGAAGFNPLAGSAYWLNTADPTTGTPYTTWAEFYQGNLASGTIPTQTNEFQNYPLDTGGGYPEIAMAALADEITYTDSPQAIQAYGYVVSQIAYAFAQAGSSESAAFASDPEWDIMPKLSDGTYLTASQMQIDTSSNNVNLTATGGDSLLSVVGGGTDTLTGGTDAVDLLYGGTGNDTLVAGSGNDYLFGGTGTNTFIDGPGNNYMSSNGTANTYEFNIAKSGSDTIANFNVNTDQLVIASNLNGDGITSVSALIAGATVTNGSTVLHLGPNDEITLSGIAVPSSLAHAIAIG